MFSCKMLLGSALTPTEKKQTGMRSVRIAREVSTGSHGRSYGIHRYGLPCLAEVLTASGYLWLSGIVDYTDSINHGVSKKGLRPAL